MADVILKDRNGEDVTYEGVSKIALPMAGGSICTFSRKQWTAETVIHNGGIFTPSDSKMTISHNLGVVPDFIFVGRLDVKDNVDRNQGHIAWAFGWSRRMTEIDRFTSSYCFPTVCIDEPDGDSNVNNGKYQAFQKSINDHIDGGGYINDANSQTFTIGTEDSEFDSGKFKLSKNAKYWWFAIGGLGIRMNPSGEVE